MLQTCTRDRMFGWWRQALRFVVPSDCVSCHRALHTDPIPLFCRECWSSIAPLTGPACSRCAQPFVSSAATAWAPDRQCQGCLDRPPAFQRAWTLYPYIPPLQDAICSFKYRRKVALANSLATLMIDALPPDIETDMIVPVPLHPARLRAREFNQSLLLADRIGRYLSRAVCAYNLVRVVATDPQTTLTRRERLRNLRHAFIVRNETAIIGRRILLVDDVFTTGATLHECAKTLLKAGAQSVSALTLARTVDLSLIPDRILAEQAGRLLNDPGI